MPSKDRHTQGQASPNASSATTGPVQHHTPAAHRNPPPTSRPPTDHSPHRRRVIIAGFGPVGRAVADHLEAMGVEVIVLEMNAATCDRQARLGRRFVRGDATDTDTLRRADIAAADALVLTIPDEDQALRACRVARQLAPHIFIAARTNFVSKGMLATAAGADHVVVEELVTAEAMSKAVAGRLGPALKSDI